MHLNDARQPLGSRVDRHAPIGDGYLGLRRSARLLAGPAPARACPRCWRRRAGSRLDGARLRAACAGLRRTRERASALGGPRPDAARAGRLRPRAASRRPTRRRSCAHFARWIARGHAGEMALPHDARSTGAADLRVAFPWARSVLAVGLQYDTPHPYSTDAHAGAAGSRATPGATTTTTCMKALLDRLVERLQAEAGPFQSRAYVDTGPIVERAYAAAAGLGRLGQEHVPAASRARLLVLPRRGWSPTSTLAPDAPRPDMCGSCTACLDACPTGALPAPYVPRRDALHQLPDDRAEGRDPRGRSATASAATSSAATSARTCCPWNRKRRQPRRRRASRPAKAWWRLTSIAPAALDRRRVPRGASAGARSSAPSGAARCATSRRARQRATLREAADPDRMAADEDPAGASTARWALDRL